jgi:hypothetical protein
MDKELRQITKDDDIESESESESEDEDEIEENQEDEYEEEEEEQQEEKFSKSDREFYGKLLDAIPDSIFKDRFIPSFLFDCPHICQDTFGRNLYEIG